MKQRLLFVVNVPWFFMSHRLPLAVAALHAGYEVHVATADGPAVEQIRSHGFIHHTIPVTRSGNNPFAELIAFWSMFRLFRRLKPHLVHLVTIKPVLYGGIAARLAGVPAVVAAVSGLGFVFIASGIRAWFRRMAVAGLYRLALNWKNVRVILQNPDDRDALLGLGALGPDHVVMIRGSGVDLVAYPALPEPEGVPVVIMAARLLKDKGVGEFVAAAGLLLGEGVKARFLLAGDLDQENPASVTSAEMDGWRSDGNVQLLGYRTDVAEIFASANLVVLPSYREGLPKVLVDAAACGRAVVTTDVPGCRDAIEPGVTGLLVPVRDAVLLAKAMRQLLEDHELRRRMGSAGRQLAEREFAIEKVVAEHLSVYRALAPVA